MRDQRYQLHILLQPVNPSFYLWINTFVSRVYIAAVGRSIYILIHSIVRLSVRNFFDVQGCYTKSLR